MIAPGVEFPAEFADRLRDIVGQAGTRSGEALHALDPGVDPRNLGGGLLARPASTQELSQVLALASAMRVAVVPQGGRTGLAGGAVSRPGQLILSLERLDRIEHIDPLSRTAVVQAGVTLERLAGALAGHGLAPGIDFGARGSATIGGMVSTNAGGSDAFRHGTMRERVLGLEVVLADGSVLAELSRVRKDNAGLPLRQLFVGAEGTLGVVSRAVLALVPAPRARRSALVMVPSLGAALRWLRALESRPGVLVVAAELMSRNHLTLTAASLGIPAMPSPQPDAFALLVAAQAAAPAVEEGLGAWFESALEAGLAQGEILDALLPKNEAEERDLWRIREDWAVDRRHPGGLWFDVSVPLDELDRYVEGLQARLRDHDPGLGIFVVGHLADGNLHVTVNADHPIPGRYAEIAPLVYEGLARTGGSFSAEHGIGLEKAGSLATWAGPRRTGLMRSVKAVFDPLGIMNPGKVIEQAEPPVRCESAARPAGEPASPEPSMSRPGQGLRPSDEEHPS